MPKPPRKIDPSQSARRPGYTSRPESELTEPQRIIRMSQAGSRSSKRKPTLAPMPWDKEQEDDK